MKFLHKFLALTGLADHAVSHAHTIVERWDVPHEVQVDGKTVPVPKDLDDRTPRMWGLADGRRITSLLTLDEVGTGGPSPAIPLVLGLIPLGMAFILLHYALSLGGVVLGIGLIIYGLGAIFSYRVTGFKVTAVAVILSLIPFFQFFLLSHILTLPGAL